MPKIRLEHVTGIAGLGICFLALAVSAPSQSTDPQAPVAAKPVNVELLHDGDTITRGSIDLGWGRSLTIGPDGESPGIRAFGYDAWEVTRGRRTVEVTEAEITKGLKARDELSGLIQSGQLYAEDPGERDPYGRVSAILWVKQGQRWIYLAGWMEQQGHLRTPRK